MNTTRISLVFDYWTDEDLSVASKFAHERASEGVTGDADYPTFRVVIDTGHAGRNIEMAEDLLMIMKR